VFVEVGIFLIPSSFDELIELAEVVLGDFGHEADTFIAADCFEHRLVVICDGSCVSIDLRSALLNGDWLTHDAKMIIECLILAEANGPD
jgi:hypothetical protein